MIVYAIERTRPQGDGTPVTKLMYSVIASLDGYVEDDQGRFDWAEPDEEVLAFVNDLERPVGTYLYGRRMYETMVYWETTPTDANPSPFVLDFAEIWQEAEKVVYSRTLESVSSANTRIERSFEPDAVRRLKAGADLDLAIGGAELAGHAISAGLVDELQLLTVPVLVGGGKRWLPTGVRLDLELLDTRRFACGVTYARYRPLPLRVMRSSPSVSAGT
jgi:dihydrofolate reductase